MADTSQPQNPPKPEVTKGEDDPATAILRPKKCELVEPCGFRTQSPSAYLADFPTSCTCSLATAPNRLFVEESTTDDNSVACLSPAKMEELGLFRGDTGEWQGQKANAL